MLALGYTCTVMLADALLEVNCLVTRSQEMLEQATIAMARCAWTTQVKTVLVADPAGRTTHCQSYC